MSLYDLLNKIKPDEIYNLGAQSHVAVSFINPEYTTNVDGIGNLRLLDAISKLKFNKSIKFFKLLHQRCMVIKKMNENSNLHLLVLMLRKLLAYWNTRIYRQAYGLFASNGIMFNHESSVRGENFISKKLLRL